MNCGRHSAVVGMLFLLGAGLPPASSALADDFHWTGLADDFTPPSGFFADPENWLELATPGAQDAIMFDLSDSYMVTLDLDPEVAVCELSAGDVIFDGRGTLRTFTADDLHMRQSSLELRWLDLAIEGPLRLDGGATLTLASESLNADSFLISDTATFIQEAGAVEVNGDVTNEGTWEHLDGTFTINGGNLDPGSRSKISGNDETMLPTLKLINGAIATDMPSTIVGSWYKGALEIRSGSQWSGGHLKLGDWYTSDGQSEGTVIVDGPGSHYTGGFTVGGVGIGRLTISNGAVADGNGCWIAGDGTSDGLVIVEGAGTQCTWDQLYIGCYSVGELQVLDGAVVNVDSWVLVGQRAAPRGVGTLRISGADSALGISIPNRLYAGDEGTGSVFIDEGGRLWCYELTIAGSSGSSGEVNVEDPASLAHIMGNLKVGSGGPGYLRALNGGTVEASYLDISHSASGGSGSVIADGQGALVHVYHDLDMAEIDGANRRATLNLYNDGTVQVDETLRVYDDALVRLHSGNLVATTIYRHPDAEFEAFGGRLTCETFDGDLDNDGVTIEPAGYDGIGTMHIIDDFVQLSGTLDLEYSPHEGTNDLIEVDGLAVLGGTLRVTLLPAAKKGEGKGRDPLTVLTSDVLVSGEFDELDLPPGYTVEYQDYAVLVIPGAPCPGDLNDDGYRDQADLGILLAAYGQTDGGDIDGDGDTDQADLGQLLSVYGVDCP